MLFDQIRIKIKLFEGIKYNNITLSKGVGLGSALWDWYYDVIDGNQTQGVRLHCLSMSGTVGVVNPPHVPLCEERIRLFPRHGSTEGGATGAQGGGKGDIYPKDPGRVKPLEDQVHR